ncbi:MAG: c-type cytochrome [Flavobacterium sp.]
MKLKMLSLAVLATVIYSCASKSNAPVAANETRPAPAADGSKPASAVVTAPVAATVMTPELAEGKELYDNNCAKCHRLYKSNEFTAEEWAPIVKRMAKKSHLDAIQEQKIYNYITMK